MFCLIRKDEAGHSTGIESMITFWLRGGNIDSIRRINLLCSGNTWNGRGVEQKVRGGQVRQTGCSFYFYTTKNKNNNIFTTCTCTDYYVYYYNGWCFGTHACPYYCVLPWARFQKHLLAWLCHAPRFSPWLLRGRSAKRPAPSKSTKQFIGTTFEFCSLTW